MNRYVFPKQRGKRDMKHLKFKVDDYEEKWVSGFDAVQFGIHSGENAYSCLHGKREIG